MKTYCTNLRTGELTEYQGYDFLAFGRLGGRYFGLQAGGLYELGGETDAGVRIEASARLHEHPLAEAQRGAEWQEKRAVAVYVDAAGAPVAVTVHADETPVGTFFGAGKVKLARGARGQHWVFTLANVGGEDLRVQAFRVLVELLRRAR
jgi:hypothetical protein